MGKKSETLIPKYRRKIGNPDCRPLPEPEQEAGAGAGNWADPHPGGQLVQEPPPARQSGSRQEQVNDHGGKKCIGLLIFLYGTEKTFALQYCRVEFVHKETYALKLKAMLLCYNLLN
jgi:hypothetical protein